MILDLKIISFVPYFNIGILIILYNTLSCKFVLMLLRLEVRLVKLSLKLSLFSLHLESRSFLSSVIFLLVSEQKVSSNFSKTENCFAKSSDNWDWNFLSLLTCVRVFLVKVVSSTIQDVITRIGVGWRWKYI